ncbi:MAG: hypothetical protein IPK82_23425 [Polyangiaceae bacterium]|nr:hypothetical protein [Polyangiaceae bacterium]
MTSTFAPFAPSRDTTAQVELPLAAVPANTDVRWLEHLLQGAHCWLTAKDIAQTSMGRVGDRDLRALASASAWIISGQKGYKHVAHATTEEITHASNWLVSQGKLMIKRGLRIKRNAHRRIG